VGWRWILVILCLLVAQSGFWIWQDWESSQIQERLDLIKEIKIFEKRFGFKETPNFKHLSSWISVYYILWYCPKFSLPYSYDDPQMNWRIFYQRPKKLPIDAETFDYFYHRVEALAGKSEITPALLKAPLDRMIMVIFHEDFHEQINYFPTGLEEPFASLAGYLLALDFSKEKFGRDSKVYQKLKRNLEYNLKSERIYRKHYRILTQLYQNFREGKISKKEALKLREKIFENLDRELNTLAQKIGIKVPKIKRNNATIALSLTYLRHLNLAYRVYLASSDLKETLKVFQSLPLISFFLFTPKEIQSREQKVVKFLKEKIAQFETEEAR
jgi:hypothetical protein